MSLININGLGIASPHRLFHNLNLTIHEGDRIGLIAGNGAGKSTLLRCLAGQAEAGSGEGGPAGSSFRCTHLQAARTSPLCPHAQPTRALPAALAATDPP